ADSVFHTDFVDKFHFMDAPKAAKFGSADWYAQNIGGAVGMLLPFLAVRRVVSPLLPEEGSTALATRGALGLSLQESMATGFVYDSLLKPSQGGNLLQDRLLNGLGGAATFSAMTLGSFGLGKLAAFGVSDSIPLMPALGNRVVNGILSGIPGGLASVGYESLRSGHAPTFAEAAQSIYGMSIAGGVLGLKSGFAKTETTDSAIRVSDSAPRTAPEPAWLGLHSSPQLAFASIADVPALEPQFKDGTGRVSTTTDKASTIPISRSDLASAKLNLSRAQDGTLLAQHENGAVELIDTNLDVARTALLNTAQSRLNTAQASEFDAALQSFSEFASKQGLTEGEQGNVLRQLNDVM
ncbi:MAG: hypothetical protein ACRD3W_32510, partial [Terriglobales bacterium]